MVTQDAQNYVWQAYLDAARLVRYYEALSSRYHRIHKWFRFLLVLPALGSLGALFDSFPDILLSLFGLIIAALVIWELVSNFGNKAYILTTIYTECCDLESEWSELWEATSSGNLSDDEVRQLNFSLEKRINSVTARASGAGIPVNEELNKQCTETTYNVMEQRYAQSP